MFGGWQLRSLVLIGAAPAVFACARAGSGGPAAPAPSAETQRPAPSPVTTRTTATALEPSDAAKRTADRVALTGLELGTMWTFENPPLSYWSREHGFNATKEWLDRVRLSSVRYGESCSASFVSPNGLVMTNHHCARECIEAASTGGTDHVEVGFHASTRAQERDCPGLFLDQLVAIQDISQRMRSALPAGATPTQITRAQEQASERIEAECKQRTGNECQVVALYQGGQHQLYQYKRYAPVKLVFAPELQAGFFGGDPDNFTYPRYALDVSFVRAYGANGQPASTPHYFRWRASGANEGELVFITGNPGSTSRLITVSQLVYEQQYRHPFVVMLLDGQRRVLQQLGQTSTEAERQVRQQLFEIENSLKAFTGQLEGLRDTLLVGTKIRWERELRARVTADAGLRQRYDDLWDELARIQARKLEISPRLNVSNKGFIGSAHMRYAGDLVTYVRAMARPEAERSEAFRSNAQRIETLLKSPSPVDSVLAIGLLTLHLEAARRWLTPGDPLIRNLLRPSESPGAAARRLAQTSRVLDPGFRQQIMTGGVQALRSSNDPLVQFALIADDTYPPLNAQWQELTAAEDVQNARLAEVLFAVYGTDQPPDATFTLRISDGVIQGYTSDGTVVPPFTNFQGLYARSAQFGNQMPFTLPASFERNRANLNQATPFNMVSTNDITGGNSGSPVIDREARIVGIAFDGNLQQLPNEFVFRKVAGRAISVHSAGILEALRNVYRATALVNELVSASQAGARR